MQRLPELNSVLSSPRLEAKAASKPTADTASLDSWQKLLRKGASGAFLVSVIGAGVGFLAHVLVARMVGQADYGVYALMLSWISVLAVVAQAGQDNNVVRFLPTYVLREEWGHARGLRRGIGWLVFVIGCVIALLGCALATWFGNQHDRAWRLTFYIGFATVPVLTQLQQSGALHRALKRAASSNAYVAIARPLVLGVVMGLLYLLLRNVDAPWAAAASAISALGALGLSEWSLARGWPAAARGAIPAYEWTKWVKVGAQMSMLSLVVVAGYRLDVLILGGLLGSADVGPYYAAVQMAGFAFYAFQAVNVILAPMIAERFDAGDLVRLEMIVRRAARLGFVGALAASVLFALIGYWVLELFGPGFVSAYVPLLVLMAGYTGVTLIGSGGFVLSMTRYQKQASLFAAIGFVVNALTAALLVPREGALGASIGAAVSLVVWHGIALRFVRKRLGINSSVLGRSLAREMA